MKKRFRQISLFCGIALIMCAAFPVFAQKDSQPQINKMPLRDFGNEVLDRVQKKDVDLSKNFLVEVSGELTKEGKFDVSKTKFVKSEGDAAMIEIGKSAIEALNDSGIFVYLSPMGVDKLNLILAQDDAQIYAVIKSESISESRAKTQASSFNAFLSMGKMTAKDEDAEILLNGTKVSTDGKSVIIKTAVEKSVGQKMIQRELEKEAARKQKTQTNG